MPRPRTTGRKAKTAARKRTGKTAATTRTRKTAAATRTRKTAAATRARGTAATGTFLCPDCGRAFRSAAALGSHRSRAHGVAGTSRARATRRRSVSGAATAGRTRTASVARGGRDGSTGAVDRDQLLRTLFPNGIPPREDVIRAVNGWLDEAEQLVARH